jgi:hypothetical protein
VAKVFLPPSQRYCLLELSSGAALAVWDLHREFTNGIAQEPISIASAIDHPDVLSFSPRGEAVALYSEGPGILQILTHLPAQPRVSSQLSTAQFGKLSRLAISDDGQILVAGFSDGTFEVHTSERGWQPLQIGYKPEAWSFLPNSHDLVISDVVLKAVVIQPRIEDSAKPLRVLAQDIQVDELAISRSGGAIVAANKTSGHVWNIDLQTETATLDEVLSGKGKLAALRDGFTFVITNPPSLSVVRVNAASLSTESKN